MHFNLSKLATLPTFLRVGCFLLILIILWIPIATPIYILVSDRNLVSLLTLPILYFEFLGLVYFWGKYIYQSENLLQKYGLKGTKQNGIELLFGLGLGVIITLSLFTLQGILGWLIWQNNVNLPSVILEGLLVALPLSFAEELLFRGWLLDEIEKDYSPQVALITNALIFALVHFIKPVSEIIRNFPGFPGLFLLGLILIWAKRGSKGLLGISIGLHGGLVWGYYMINVGKLVKYSQVVPDWITGVDKNPLAGIMGLLFLSILAVVFNKRTANNI